MLKAISFVHSLALAQADSQLIHLPRISGLDAVPLTLSRVSSDSRKVVTGDSQDGTSIIVIRVEAAGFMSFSAC